MAYYGLSVFLMDINTYFTFVDINTYFTVKCVVNKIMNSVGNNVFFFFFSFSEGIKLPRYSGV